MNIEPSAGFVGCVIIDPDQYWKHTVKTEHLHGGWADLYAEIGFMLAEGEAVDEQSVTHRCRNKPWWPAVRVIHDLTAKIPSAHLAGSFARMVTDDGRKTELNAWADNLKQRLKSGIDEGLAEEAASKLASIFEEQRTKPWHSLAEMAAEFKAQGVNAVTEKRIYTGADALDHNWVLDDGGLHLLAGRPGMGKTSVALWIAQQLIDHGEAVLYFSLEMTREQLLTKLLASWSGRNKDDLHLDGELIQILDEHASAPLFVADAGRQTVESISIRSHIATKRQNVRLIIVDYVQQVRTVGKYYSREQEVAHVSGSLKALAKSIRCPVLALAQLNRNVESRESKRPQLADLRESGALEADADSAGLLYRQEYYDEMVGRPVDEDNKGVVELAIAKQRRRGPRRLIATWKPETNTLSWWKSKEEKKGIEGTGKYYTPPSGDREGRYGAVDD